MFPSEVSAQPDPAPAAAAEGRARLEGLGAGVELRATPTSAPTPLTAGAALPSRFELRTGAEAQKIVFPDGTRIEVAPRSKIARLGSVDVAVLGTTKVQADHVNLVAGELALDAPASTRAGSVLVSSHDAYIAALPSTLIHVAARTAHGVPALGVGVLKGEARYVMRGAWKPLLAGQAVETAGNAPPPPPSALPGAPLWWPAKGACTTTPATDCSLGLAIGQDSGQLTLGWAETPGAAGYVLEIARDAAFRDVVATRETNAKSAAVTLGIGRYFARVQAQGALRIPGFPSATREVRVARVDLPAGTRAQDGAWFLPHDRQVDVGTSSGLELGIGRTGFVTAPSHFGLLKDEPTVARLRFPGAPDFFEVTLKPSTIRATVSISPQNPVWPFDTILARVNISDAGKPVPAAFEPKFRVEVNSTVLPTTWWRHDNLWAAQIGSRVPPGPWLVHIEVRDPHDNPLGEAFVEVSGPPQPIASAKP